jgi:hypothetical protein
MTSATARALKENTHNLPALRSRATLSRLSGPSRDGGGKWQDLNQQRKRRRPEIPALHPLNLGGISLLLVGVLKAL